MTTPASMPGCPDCGCGFVHGTREGHPPKWLVAVALGYISSVESDVAASDRDTGGWTAAKASDNPHEYTVRQKAWERHDRGVGHESLVELLRWYYVLRWFKGRGYRSLDIDTHSYWIMTDGTIINRKPISASGWDPEE